MATGARFASRVFFFFQAKAGIRYVAVTGVQTCALPISIDRPAVNEVSCLGFCPPTSTIIPRVMDFALQTPAASYDPEKAKKLLAEAGYPNGFDAGDRKSVV